MCRLEESVNVAAVADERKERKKGERKGFGKEGNCTRREYKVINNISI
jgi:hypothetical protein